MTESKWESLCLHHAIRVEYGDHASIITESTCAIQQTIQQLLQQLNNRAMSLTACVQYDLALEDAAMMREIAPWSSLGYLRACDVYSNQCRHKAMIDICTQGLVAMAKDDPGYHKLETIKNKAKHTNNKRVDFISKLSSDVVLYNILPRITDSIMPFSSTTPSPLFYVSRAWHQRFLQAPDGLAFHARISNTTSNIAGHGQLLRYAPYVTRLDVQDVACGIVQMINAGSFLSTLFTCGNFSRFRTLNMRGRQSRNILPTPLRYTLAILGNTLKHLSITIDQHPVSQPEFPIIVSDILQRCRNLVSLTIENIHVDLSALSSTMQYTKMRHFKYFQPKLHTTRRKEYITMLALFPSLVSLALNPSSGEEILSEIHQYCPLLEQLIYWDRDHECHATTHNKCNLICIGSQRSNLTMEKIAMYMIQRAACVETFDFQGTFWNERNDLEALRTLSPSPFSKLRSISFTNVNQHSTLFVQWVIRHASHIQSITLSDGALCDSVVDAMMQLNNIHTLDIRTDDDKNLSPFIKHHINMGTQSTLRNIQLSSEYDIPRPSWLQDIAKLRNLECFELRIPSCFPAAFASFLEAMAKGCPNLKQLKLVAQHPYDASMLAYIKTGVIEVLVSFNSLHQLTLHASAIHENRLLLLTKIPNLRCLNLRLNRSPRPTIMDRLRADIPHVVIELCNPE
ncbi:hypothetical protein K492DRAFT_211998 [Lichtheimia hyalospora FSU 10163]|nr:hypothetical protein K492DRAFT_211998 [Lichtheimia hyalospora FSU 10163]